MVAIIFLPIVDIHIFHRSTGENDFGLIETLGSMEDTICLINKDIGNFTNWPFI